MVDKDTILQVLCGLMKNPQLLSETDKYRLTPDDFTTLFEKIVFSSIYNLYKDGAQKITVFDIDTYLNTHKASKATFEKNKGIEYLQDGLEFVQEENFPFYYKRLKKFNCLRDLKKEGYDISRFYEPDYSNPKAKEINEKFEKMEVSDIFNSVRKSFIKVETDYSLGEGTETTDATHNLKELLDELKVKPEVGMALQGDIFNTICRGARKTKFYIRSSSSGVGKALPNSTLIPTPNGWKRVDEIKVGDYLFDGFGKPTKVLGVFPQGEKEVYNVNFKDGRQAHCCSEHLWSFCTPGQKKESKEERKFYTETLQEIIDNRPLVVDKASQVLVPVNMAVEYEEKPHLIPPYIFGLALGDGSFRQHNTNKSFQFSSESEELPNAIGEVMGWVVKRNSSKNFTWCFGFKDQQEGREKINVWVEDFLIEYPDLINVKSNEKYIPRNYLEDSVENRFELLNGLLDSDGAVDLKGRVGYTTNSLKLAENVQELCRSLGFMANITIDDHKDTSKCYNLRIYGRPDDKVKLFKLKRKKERILNWYNSRKRKEKNEFNPIVSIEKTGRFEEMTCFLVDNEEHLFLTEDFIVTHNTRLSLGDACNLSYPVKFNTENWRWEWTGANEKTLFIATEQELSEIQTLILAFLTGFNEEKILYSNYNSEEYKIVKQAIKVMERYKDNLFIVRLANPNIEQVKAVVKQNWVVNNIQNVFYDYIFSSPSLLNEFRDLHIREDVALAMFSTALKDLAVDLGLFVMSSTQTNAKSEDGKPIKNEAVIRGSRAIIDKCDVACVVSRVTKEDLALLEAPISVIGCAPDQVTDIYKVRRGRYTNVKVWSYTDLGTCRKKDLFITDDRYNAIEGFECLTFNFQEADTTGIVDFLKDLNDSVENDNELELNSRSAAAPKINLDDMVAEDNFAKGGFGELL